MKYAFDEKAILLLPTLYILGLEKQATGKINSNGKQPWFRWFYVTLIFSF